MLPERSARAVMLVLATAETSSFDKAWQVNCSACWFPLARPAELRLGARAGAPLVPLATYYSGLDYHNMEAYRDMYREYF